MYKSNRKSLLWLYTYKSVRQQLNGCLKQNRKPLTPQKTEAQTEKLV